MKSQLRLLRLVSTTRDAGGDVEGADHRHWRLAGRCDAQVGAAPGPGVGEIRMGERLGFVFEQEDDVAGQRLLLQQAKAQAGAVDGGGVRRLFRVCRGRRQRKPPFYASPR